MPIMFSL